MLEMPPRPRTASSGSRAWSAGSIAGLRVTTVSTTRAMRPSGNVAARSKRVFGRVVHGIERTVVRWWDRSSFGRWFDVPR